MASLLMRIFKSEVAVEFAKDRITLKAGDKIVSFEPILFISSAPNKQRILGFGSDYVPKEAYIRVEQMKPGVRQQAEFINHRVSGE